MKKLKIITGVLSAISALVMVAVPFLSSYMQGFYKSQIDDFFKKRPRIVGQEAIMGTNR